MFNSMFSGVKTGVLVIAILLMTVVTPAAQAYSYGYGYGYGYGHGYGYGGDKDKMDPVIAWDITHFEANNFIVGKVIISDDKAISADEIEVSIHTTATVTDFVCTQKSDRHVECYFTVTRSGNVHIRAYDAAGNRENETAKGFKINFGDPVIATCNAEINEQYLAEKPEPAALCSVGSPSAEISGDGSEENPWVWTCYDPIGHPDNMCSAFQDESVVEDDEEVVEVEEEETEEEVENENTVQNPQDEEIVVQSDIVLYELYRFWSPSRKAHFYTTSRTERDSVIPNKNLDYGYEGVTYHVSPAETGRNSQAIYRFWSPVFESHFYTSSETERDDIIAENADWIYEGIAFYGTNKNPGTDSLSVYRFWSEVYQTHFYTASETEALHVSETDSNWSYEGIAWYIDTNVSPVSTASVAEVNLSPKAQCIEAGGMFNEQHDVCFMS